MRVMRDARGKDLEFSHPPRRVVSLVPSITETLFDLGAGDQVVGVTDFCIFPPDIDRPRLGGTKNPRVDAIRALAPDLVHMNLEENLRKHGEAIELFVPVFASEPKSVSDVEQLIGILGAMHGRPDAAGNAVQELRNAVRALPRRSFTFACPIWKAPWMWCGGDTYVSSLITTAGGRNVLGGHQRYPTLSLDDVAAMKPDVIFLPDEPYAFTEWDAENITTSRVVGPFPGHLFTWHGTRTIKGLKFLRDAL
jgi:ABC-type Fe3+-hydroxamate transport system substrate-binding protein